MAEKDLSRSHLTTEDFERYTEEDNSEEYLGWLKPVQQHINQCDGCRKRLGYFLTADRLINNFSAFLGGFQLPKSKNRRQKPEQRQSIPAAASITTPNGFGVEAAFRTAVKWQEDKEKQSKQNPQMPGKKAPEDEKNQE